MLLFQECMGIMSSFYSAFQTSARRQDNAKNGIEIGKEIVTPPLFIDNMIVHTKITRNILNITRNDM